MILNPQLKIYCFWRRCANRLQTDENSVRFAFKTLGYSTKNLRTVNHAPHMSDEL